jgi:hypothetical protein
MVFITESILIIKSKQIRGLADMSAYLAMSSKEGVECSSEQRLFDLPINIRHI